MIISTDPAGDLVKAQAAYAKLVTGGLAVRVQQGDQIVEFTKADSGQLLEYIQQLQQQIDGSCGRGRRAIGVIF